LAESPGAGKEVVKAPSVSSIRARGELNTSAVAKSPRSTASSLHGRDLPPIRWQIPIRLESGARKGNSPPRGGAESCSLKEPCPEAHTAGGNQGLVTWRSRGKRNRSVEGASEGHTE
jgi:hypothetical protein